MEKIIVNEYGIKIVDISKSVPNLGNKSKYVIDYENLQYICH